MSAEDFVKLSVRAAAELALAGVSDAAELAFYRGLQEVAYTHGIVPKTRLANLGPRRVADELVEKGFWEPMPNGWRYLAWDKWNAELEQLNEKRAKDAARKRDERRAARATRLGLVVEESA